MKRELKSNWNIRTYIVFLVSILILSAAFQNVKAATSGDYIYTVTDNQATITEYFGSGVDLVIPSTLGGYPVVAIDDYAFFGGRSSLITVTIPNSVTSIGSYVFLECSLLRTVNIPSSVVSIADYAFHGCIELSAINVDEANPSYKSIQGVLFDKEGTTLIQYPRFKWEDASYTIPNTVTTIGKGAFSACYYLTSITIPDSVTSIGDESFYDCYFLPSITIPSSVTSIGDSAFYWCDSLTSITFLGLTPPTTGTDWISFTNSELLGHAFYVSSFPIPGDSFNGLTMGNYIPEDYYYKIADGLATITGYHGAGGDITMPSTLGGCPVVAIGRLALYGKPLTSVVIPNSVTSIGDYSFGSCKSLTSVTLSNGVVSIGYQAFSFCTSLTSVTIDSVITSIGNGAFFECSSLTSFNFGSGADGISSRLFAGCSSLSAINVDAANPSYKSIDGVLFDEEGTTLIQYPMKKLDTSYTIPNTVTTIDIDAFHNCDFLTSITIPNSVTSIGRYAFLDCSSLTSITMPRGVISIGPEAFTQCTSLASVTIPDTVTSIGNGAFTGCSSLTSVTIPNSVTSISDSTFVNCHSLTSVTIPDSVTSIGKSAFYWCESLASITIPSSVTSIGDAAFYSCYSLSSITIPNKVTSIGNWAFAFCGSLTSITVSSSVTSIGNCAFWYCGSLTSINFLGLTPPTIGTDWIYYSNSAILGHACFGSSFPAPGYAFNGLMMGDYIPDPISPTITSASPSSPITLYTQGTGASQTFSASYTDNINVASATVTLDGTDVSSVWGVSTSGFSYSAALPKGSHTIVLTVTDIADSQGQQRSSTQTWSVTVVKDTKAPSISGIADQKIRFGTGIEVVITDSLSGVNWDSLIVTMDNNDITTSVRTANGFSLTSTQLTKGAHTVNIIVSDNLGNTAKLTCDIIVK